MQRKARHVREALWLFKGSRDGNNRLLLVRLNFRFPEKAEFNVMRQLR